MAPYKNDCGEKNWATVQDKKMQFIKWLLPKKRSQTVAKNGTLQKWQWPKKSKPNSVGKKNAPYKNDSDQKNRNQPVENKKWHPINMTAAKKIEPQCKTRKCNL